MMKKQDANTWQFLISVMEKGKWNIMILVAAQTLIGISSVLYALLLRDIINEAVAGKEQEFFSCIFLFVLLVCFQLLLRALVRFQEENSRSSLENRFKKRLFSTLMSKNYSYISAVHSGEWMNRLTSDTVVVANGLTDILPNVIGMAVKLVGAVVMIVMLEPRFLYLIVPGGSLLIFLSYAFRKVMKKLHKGVQEQDGRLRMFLQESLGSMLVVRSYGVENSVTEVAAEKMAAHKQWRMKRNHFSNICNIGFGAIMNGAYVLGALLCGYGILTRSMSYGTFMAMLQLIGQIQAPFANISGFLPRYYAMMASCERLMEVEKIKDKMSVKIESLEQIQAVYVKEFQGIGLKNAEFSYLPPVQDLSNNQEKYREEKDGTFVGNREQMPIVLSNLNLEIKKGEYVAFTGSSGCGKSTVLKILLCLYDLDEGERYLLTDGKQTALNGNWQKLFAYVPQGNHLMSGTIREIVSFANKEKSNDDVRVREALSIACAEFVYELEQGVDTLLGERGLGLSEGQMQRLAIARAVFSQHPILMLDEATSALDEATEKRLLKNLRSMTDRTVLIVTHRLAALEICNKIFAFTEQGCERIK